MRANSKPFWRILPALLAAMLLVAGCGGDYSSDGGGASTAASYSGGAAADTTAYEYESYDYDYDDADYDYDDAEAPDMGGAEAGGGEMDTVPSAERKIVYTVDLNLETKDFEAGVAFIEALTDEFGGFMQSANIRGTGINDAKSARWANHTARIPADLLDEYVDRLEEEFNSTYNSRYSDDITDSYYDLQARIDSLQIAYDQLQLMLEQAEELEYLIEVQRELTSVRAQLESYLSARNRMDSSVSLSTVNISLQEVLDYQPQTPISITFGERVSRAFRNSWRGFVSFCQNAVLFLISALPFLVLLAVIAAALIPLLRRRKRRRAAPPEPEPSPNPEADGEDEAARKSDE